MVKLNLYMATQMSRRLVLALVVTLVMAATLVGSGCASMKTAPSRGSQEIQAAAVMPVPGKRVGKGGAAILVYEFKNLEGAENDFACRWRMINQESGKSFFLDLKGGQTTASMALDPGVYKTGRLGCGLSRVWDIDDVFQQGFRVEEGSASYLGKLIFEFKHGELDQVRKASRPESAKALAPALAQAPVGQQTLISGFTGRKIEPSMVEAGVLENFDVLVKGVDAKEIPKMLESMLTQLKNCSKESAQADPVRFGRLEYVALYKEGRFSEMTARQDANGFSDQFRSCIERGMMSFHPSVKKDVEVRVRY